MAVLTPKSGIPKITIGKLYKLFHDVIIILFSTFHIIQSGTRKQLQTFECLKSQKWLSKKEFIIVFQRLSFGEMQKIAGTSHKCFAKFTRKYLYRNLFFIKNVCKWLLLKFRLCLGRIPQTYHSLLRKQHFNISFQKRIQGCCNIPPPPTNSTSNSF